MLFEKLSFQEQNYGMKGIQLATSGRLNSLDKILLVVLFLLIIVVLYMFFVCKKANKLDKKILFVPSLLFLHILQYHQYSD